MAEATNKSVVIVPSTAQEWAEIINSAVSLLTMDYLRGLQSIDQIIGGDVPYSRHYNPSDFYDSWEARQLKGLLCAHLKPLPSDKESWPHIVMDDDPKYHLVREHLLILERNRNDNAFWHISITWKLNAKVDPIWLQGIQFFSRKVELERVFQDHLACAPAILTALVQAQQKTTEQLQSRLNTSSEHMLKLQHLLESAGCTV